jgi:hypothetical protein
LRNGRGVAEGSFSVVPFFPEQFIHCSSRETRDTTLAASSHETQRGQQRLRGAAMPTKTATQFAPKPKLVWVAKAKQPSGTAVAGTVLGDSTACDIWSPDGGTICELATGAQPASDPMVLEAGLPCDHPTKIEAAATAAITAAWSPDEGVCREQATEAQSASDPMILEAGLLCDYPPMTEAPDHAVITPVDGAIRSSSPADETYYTDTVPCHHSSKAPDDSDTDAIAHVIVEWCGIGHPAGPQADGSNASGQASQQATTAPELPPLLTPGGPLPPHPQELRGTSPTVEGPGDVAVEGFGGTAGAPTTPRPQPEPVQPESTPTPNEAARRLERFKAKVLVTRPAPLIASPPKQRALPRRSHIQTRSTRIAAQPLSHIPTAKRGEVLLKKKLGIPPPPPPITTASQSTQDAIRNRRLSEAQIAAYDALFPAANCRTGRASRRTDIAAA